MPLRTEKKNTYKKEAEKAKRNWAKNKEKLPKATAGQLRPKKKKEKEKNENVQRRVLSGLVCSGLVWEHACVSSLNSGKIHLIFEFLLLRSVLNIHAANLHWAQH